LLSWLSGDESRWNTKNKIVLILFDYGNVGGLNWDPGYGRVGIGAEGGGGGGRGGGFGNFKNPFESDNKLSLKSLKQR